MLRYFYILFLVLTVFSSCNNSQATEQEQNVEPVTETETTLPPDHYSIWEKDIQAFEDRDKANPPAENGIVFVGSSSIRFWTSLAEDMAPLPTIRRGFGGSKIADAIHYSDRIITNYKPQIVVVFSGTNDLSGNELDKTPEVILNDYKTLVAKITKVLPETKIYNISITPTPAREVKIKEIIETNHLIKEYSEANEQLFFFDLQDQFITETGAMRPELFIEDGLHLNEDGYRLWVETIKPVLLSAYKK